MIIKKSYKERHNSVIQGNRSRTRAKRVGYKRDIKTISYSGVSTANLKKYIF